MGADLTLAVPGVNKVQTGRRRIASIGGKLSALVIPSVIGIENLQISSIVSVRHFQVRVVLHRKRRIQRGSGHHLQHGACGIERHRHDRHGFLSFFHHHAVQFFRLSLMLRHCGKLYARLRFLRRVGSGLDFFSRLPHQIRRRNLCRNLAAGNIQRLSAVCKIQIQHGNIKNILFFGSVLSGEVLRRLILRLTILLRHSLQFQLSFRSRRLPFCGRFSGLCLILLPGTFRLTFHRNFC